MTRSAQLVRAFAAFTIALAATILVEIEWTTANCGPGELDQPYAAYGTPLPYRMWSGVSSMQFDFIPWALGVNIALFAGVVWLLLRKLPIRWSVWHMVWIVPLAMFGILLLSVVNNWPVAALGGGQPVAITQFRPVGLGYGGYNCTPSSFWFPAQRS